MMRAVLFTLWLAAVIQISWWTWHVPTPVPISPQLTATDTPSKPASSGAANAAAPNDDLEAFKAYQDMTGTEGFRAMLRKGTLETLSGPWSSFCEETGHKRLIDTISNYYYQMYGALSTAENFHGPKVAAYVREQFHTADDLRILDLIQQHYRNGYFTVDEFRDFQRKAVVELVRDEKPRGKACS